MVSCKTTVTSKECRGKVCAGLTACGDRHIAGAGARLKEINDVSTTML